MNLLLQPLLAWGASSGLLADSRCIDTSQVGAVWQHGATPMCLALRIRAGDPSNTLGRPAARFPTLPGACFAGYVERVRRNQQQA